MMLKASIKVGIVQMLYLIIPFLLKGLLKRLKACGLWNTLKGVI